LWLRRDEQDSGGGSARTSPANGLAAASGQDVVMKSTINFGTIGWVSIEDLK